MDPPPTVPLKEGNGRVSRTEWPSSEVSHEDASCVGASPPVGAALGGAGAGAVGLYCDCERCDRLSASLIRRSQRPRARGLMMEEAIESVALPMLTLRRERLVRGVSMPLMRPPLRILSSS